MTEQQPLGSEAELTRDRGYLLLLAEGRLDPRLRNRVDPKELVRAVLAGAVAARAAGSASGRTGEELAGWLRSMLARELVAITRLHGRVAGRARSAEAAVETALKASSQRLERLLAAEHSGASESEKNWAQILNGSDQLAELPEPQRWVIEMRYLQNLSAPEIAARLDQPEVTVADLLENGVRHLRAE